MAWQRAQKRSAISRPAFASSGICARPAFEKHTSVQITVTQENNAFLINLSAQAHA
jgi:hypothetical protein